MGESAPFQQERGISDGRSDGRALTAAALIDPIALEERLKVARARRAEAVAKRTSTAAAPELRGPAPPQPHRNPNRPIARPLPVDRPDLPSSAHPLVVLLVLGLSASALLGARTSEPADPTALVLAAPTPEATPLQVATAPVLAAPSPLAPETAGSPPPAAPRTEAPQATLPAAAPPAPVLPAPATATASAPQDPPAPEPPAPAPIEAAAPVPAEITPPEAAPVPAQTARNESLLIYVPRGAKPDGIDATLASLRDAGFAQIADQSTGLTIRQTNVRFYNAEDAAAAQEVAALIGGDAVARDFTAAATPVSPGRLEIWIAGAPSAPDPRSSQPTAQGNTVRPPRQDGPTIAAIERGIAAVAEELGSVTDAAGRDISRAVNEAIRALEGR